MSPIGDSTDQAVKELAGNGTNYLVEFSDSILNTSNFDIAIWNPASETITYYAKKGNGYSFVSSNKPQDKQGEWTLSGNRWWYRYADGTWPQNCLVSINGNTYAFDSDGWMMTGWTPPNSTIAGDTWTNLAKCILAGFSMVVLGITSPPTPEP